jgi:predicted DNA-binding transcriptional regulator AlpA
MTGIDSQQAANSARRKAALHDAAALMRQLLWSVPEAAFMCRVAGRTVWRLMADPNSKFPKPRRARGRTLLVRDEVLAYFNLPGGEAN